MLVVDREQGIGQHFLGLNQVVDVGLRVVRAGVAVATRHDRVQRPAKPGVGDVESAVVAVDRRIAPRAGCGRSAARRRGCRRA